MHLLLSETAKLNTRKRAPTHRAASSGITRTHLENPFDEPPLLDGTDAPEKPCISGMAIHPDGHAFEVHSILPVVALSLHQRRTRCRFFSCFADVFPTQFVCCIVGGLLLGLGGLLLGLFLIEHVGVHRLAGI